VTGVRLGLRANAAQFSLLVGLNALVGALVGLERSVLPLVGRREFRLRSDTAILAFVLAFGATKALANLAAGALADRIGRKRLLVLGWLLALPVAPLVVLAPNWSLVVVANVLLGANQGLAWSMTVLMKIDLAGPARRGLALGLNESAGYLGVAVTAFASGALAASIAPRTVVWVGALAIALAGTLIAVVFVRDTGEHVAQEQAQHGERVALPLRSAFAEASLRQPVLRTCSQAGLVNNLNDALAWGLAPLYLAAHGASATQVGVAAAVYPGIWGILQLGTGWLSDQVGRKPLISWGMLVQAGALALLVAGGGAFGPSVLAAALLGIGTALVYPTLIAAVSDAVLPRDRAAVVGVYRFWRDSGFVAGALLAGVVADALGSGASIAIVAGLTGLSGLLVAATPWQERYAPDRLRFRRWLPSPTSPRPMRAGFLRSRQHEHPSWEGGAMRAIECPCGHHLEGADDEELFRRAREHVDRDHPEMQRTDAQLRERIAADAYDLEGVTGGE
jgi:MFS family permease